MIRVGRPRAQTDRIVRFAFASLVGLLATGCSDQSEPEGADEAVCATVREVGQDFLSDVGPDDPLAKLAEAAGEGSAVASLADDLNDVAQQEQLSADDADRFTQLSNELEDELRKACPELAERAG